MLGLKPSPLYMLGEHPGNRRIPTPTAAFTRHFLGNPWRDHLFPLFHLPTTALYSTVAEDRACHVGTWGGPWHPQTNFFHDPRAWLALHYSFSTQMDQSLSVLWGQEGEKRGSLRNWEEQASSAATELEPVLV